MAETELYVVTDGLPGPNAPSLEVRADLVRRIREAADGGAMPVSLALEAADQLSRVGAQFVELENADGVSVGPASGVDWEAYPGKYSEETQTHTLYRIGPFLPPERRAEAETELPVEGGRMTPLEKSVATIAEELTRLRALIEFQGKRR